MKSNQNSRGDERRESSIRAMEGILALEIDDAHKKRLLSRCIWFYTEADGKWKTKYESYAVHAGIEHKMRRHEHVYTRKKLIAELQQRQKSVSEIAQHIIACIVTAEEHKKLHEIEKKNPKLDGWVRYKQAGIDVVERQTGKRFIFPQK
jgi:hypothetical protein